MSESVAIFVDARDPKSRFDYKITLRDAAGQPLAGKDVVVTIEGDGSLQPNHDAKQIVRETNDAGGATFSWFRRSIFGRNVKATVTAAARDLPDANVTLESVEVEAVNTGYSTKTWPMRVGGRNVWPS